MSFEARLGRAAEAVWSAAFSARSLVGAGRRSPGRHLDPPARVLVVAPHPDDESIGCAGALLLHKQQGARMIVACVTDGRGSRALGLGPDDMAARRRAEADSCARILGIDRLEWFGLREGEWGDEALMDGLARVMEQHRPALVYAPSLIDFHPEHRRVASVLGRFWTQSPLKADVVRIYPIQVPLTSALTNVVIDVTDVMPQVRAALDAYATQAANMARALRQRRYAGRRYRAGEYAEEFWQVDTAAYVRLHQDDIVRAVTDFRGVRNHPATDPLAYLTGWRSRRRLRSE